MNDVYYMRRALALARRGGRAVHPNPKVGAVIVLGNKIVGKGWHRRHGEPHAEVEALRDAGDSARGATLYVTLEPCNHTGNTPPCSEAILKAGIARVVVAMEDPNLSVKGGGSSRLQSAGVTVETGCLEAEARELNIRWVHRAANRKPMLHAVCCLGLNGGSLSLPQEVEAELVRRFEPDEMRVIGDFSELGAFLSDRLVVIHAPELSSAPGGFPLSSRLSLLRARRRGRYAVSTYEILLR